MIAGKPTITTQTLTLADTEYSVSIPAGAIRFEVKERTGASLLRIAVASGGSYITIPYGASYSEIDIKGPVTLYIQSPDAGAVVEIKYWK
jgi:hypothetical protein